MTHPSVAIGNESGGGGGTGLPCGTRGGGEGGSGGSAPLRLAPQCRQVGEGPVSRIGRGAGGGPHERRPRRQGIRERNDSGERLGAVVPAARAVEVVLRWATRLDTAHTTRERGRQIVTVEAWPNHGGAETERVNDQQESAAPSKVIDAGYSVENAASTLKVERRRKSAGRLRVRPRNEAALSRALKRPDSEEAAEAPEVRSWAISWPSLAASGAVRPRQGMHMSSAARTSWNSTTPSPSVSQLSKIVCSMR
eukprot:scaffold198869_cov27-Tisochrysis_lutea.AAC.1